MLNTSNKSVLAYVLGVALGDGNLSNPNGRAVRLRITCDVKYPKIISNIEKAIKLIAPENKVARVYRKDNSVDVSCYSNDWEKILGWKAKEGSKEKQKISVPSWILENKVYSKDCLRGLFETDGSIYKDREYLNVNFVTQIPTLAESVSKMLALFKYKISVQKLRLPSDKLKFTFRIHTEAKRFIKEIGIVKK